MKSAEPQLLQEKCPPIHAIWTIQHLWASTTDKDSKDAEVSPLKRTSGMECTIEPRKCSLPKRKANICLKPTCVWFPSATSIASSLGCFWYLVWVQEKKYSLSLAKDFGLLVFIVSSLWSANKSAVPRNRPHGRFAAHDQSLQAIDCRTWRIWDTHPAERWKKYCKGSHVESSNPFISFIREAPCWTSRKKNTPGASRKTWVVFLPFLWLHVCHVAPLSTPRARHKSHGE